MSAKTILLVDDETEILDFMSDLLELEGYHCERCYSSAEAIEILKTKARFDLIISDYQMKGGTGLDIFRFLDERGNKTPFLLISGVVSRDEVGGDLNEGSFLSKPFDKNSFLKKIQFMIERVAPAIDSSDDDDFLKEVLESFKDEAVELLDGIDEKLMKLEEGHSDQLLDDLFRRIHSLKGSSASLPGGALMSSLAHEFEAVLVELKARKLTMTSGLLDLTLFSADLLKKMIGLLASQEEVPESLSQQVDGALKVYRAKGYADFKRKAQDEGAGLSDEEEAIPVKMGQLDQMMVTCGELVVLRNRLSFLASELSSLNIPTHLKRRLNDMAVGQNKTIDMFQKQLLSVRQVSLQKTLAKLVRVVREASRDQGKIVEYQHGNLDFGVDKTIANALSLSLTHMVRNCIGHGIEAPNERKERGKPEKGLIYLDVVESNGTITATLKDDGAGINVRAIRERVVERGLLSQTEMENTPDQQIIQYIFEPGFSTAKQVDSVSGRGVGMDVVRTAATSLGGDIHLDSKEGQGTTITIKIPVLKTIMVESTIIVRSGHTSLSVPVKFIDKILSRKEVGEVRSHQEGLFFRYGEKVLEVLFAEDLLNGLKAPLSDKKAERLDQMQNIVVLIKDKKAIALAVDRVLGQLDSVIRPFDQYYEVEGFSGTTLLDDDTFAYVIGEELFEMSLRPPHEVFGATERRLA